MELENSSRSIAEILNRTLLGISVQDELAELNNRIVSAQQALRDLLIQKQRATSKSVTSVTDKAVAGFLKSVNDCYASVNSGSSEGYRLAINFVDAPIRFHLMHGRIAVGNNNVIYVTLPLYSFSAKLMHNGSVALSNMSTVRMYKELASEVEDSRFSHPHVGHAAGRGDSFNSICFGTNKFLDGINSTVTPASFLEFARRFHIWATHANLNDMYDSNAYKNPRITDKVKDIIADADRLFTLAQKSIVTNTAEDVSNLISAVRDAGLPVMTHCEAFIRAYAAWFLHNSPDLSNAYNYLNRRSLMAAARLDLVAELPDDSYSYSSSIEKEVFGAPAALKALIMHEEREHGSNVNRRRLLNKFII